MASSGQHGAGDCVPDSGRPYNKATEMGQWSSLVKGKELTVVGPESKPRLLPRKKLKERKWMRQEERREVKQKKAANIAQKAFQNSMVQKMAAGAYHIEN